MFFHVGEEMKVRRCQIRAVGRVLKNFSVLSFQKIHCRMSYMQSGIVIQQQQSLVWHLRPLALNISLDCLIRRRKVQQKHTIHVPKHCRHQFPTAGWCLEFFDGGRPWMLLCHGLRLCLRIVLVHPSFIPSTEFQLELSLLPTKTEYLINPLLVSTHTQYSSHCGTASSTKIAEFELQKSFHLATNVWTLSE